MTHHVRIGTLALAGMLACSAAAPALAAEYADLSWDHWAYSTLQQAASLGILQGVGGNRMEPAATMSWGQFLSISARSFAPQAYQEALADGQAWDMAGYTAALESGMLSLEDALPVTPASLNAPISRQDAAVILYRALPESVRGGFSTFAPDPTLFTDWSYMDDLHQEAVGGLVRCGVVRGKSDGSFGFQDTIQRCDGATLLMNTLNLVDQARWGEEQDITIRYLNAETGEELLPQQQFTSSVGDYLSRFEQDLSAQHYTFAGFDQVYQVSSACSTYTLEYRPMTQSEIVQAEFWAKVERGEANAEDFWTQDFWLVEQGENTAKLQLLFGDPGKRRFVNKEEAQANMVTITVPVWHLSGSGKKASTASFQVHAALAQDVTEIFTEIYQDPEQFPIQDLGGYSWRGDSATGEHNCGTAIDINSDNNYQVRDGVALAGSRWQPGQNPYSISPDSSVVRIFKAHGWSWGGDAWAYSTNPAEGYHDYMHFSYMGG